MIQYHALIGMARENNPKLGFYALNDVALQVLHPELGRIVGYEFTDLLDFSGKRKLRIGKTPLLKIDFANGDGIKDFERRVAEYGYVLLDSTKSANKKAA